MRDQFYFKRKDLLFYCSNMYYYYIKYKLTNNEKCLVYYKQCRASIKRLTKLTTKEITDIFYSINISDQSISRLYYSFVQWVD